MLEILISFFGGLLSFASPCFFPLIPTYISIITGISLKKEEINTRTALLYSIVFVLGFSISFSILGASAAFIGKILRSYKNEIMFVAGLMLIFFGLNIIRVIKFQRFMQEKRIDITRFKLPEYIFPLVFGIFFAVGWTPCIGPILAGILVIASSHDLRYGAFLLFIYSLGIGIPFIIASIFISKFIEFSRRFKSFLRGVEIFSGISLITFGLIFLSNKINKISFSIFDISSIEEKLAKISADSEEDDLKSSRKALARASSEIYKRVFSGEYIPANNIFPVESNFVIINFWSTYCIPCRKEIPELVSAQSKYEISIISIADDSKENIKEFIRENKINYPILLLSEVLKDKIYSPYGLPESLFFYNGKLVGRYIGMINEEIIKNFLSLDFSFLEEEEKINN